MVLRIAEMNFGLGDMNSYTPDAVSSVKIIADSVGTVVFGNTDIPHPCNHTVPQRSVAVSSSIYIYLILP